MDFSVEHAMKRFWNDDTGAVLATEILFVITTLVIGTVAGLVALRQAIVGEMIELANAVMTLDQSYKFTGQSFACASTAGSSASDQTNTIQAASVAAQTASINQNPCD